MTKEKKIFLSVGAALLIAAIAGRKKIKQTFTNMSSEDLINELHPAARERFKLFAFKAAQQGTPFDVIEGRRTFEQQAQRYAQGRTAPGKIVTNSPPGSSWHEFAAAIDIIPVVNGKRTFTPPAGTWEKLASLGKSLGLVWGGDFKKLKDVDHFELHITKDLKTAQTLLAAKKIDTNGYLVV